MFAILHRAIFGSCREDDKSDICTCKHFEENPKRPRYFKGIPSVQRLTALTSPDKLIDEFS